MIQKTKPVDLEQLCASFLGGIEKDDPDAVKQKKIELFREAGLQLHQAGYQDMEFGDEMAKLHSLAADFFAQGSDDAKSHVTAYDQRKTAKLNVGDGAKYDGEILNGKFDGKGVLTWSNGDTYKGDWRDGKMHGTGTLTQANGNIFVGEFEHGTFKAHLPWGYKVFWLAIFATVIFTTTSMYFGVLPEYREFAQRQFQFAGDQIRKITKLGEGEAEDIEAEFADVPEEAFTRSNLTELPSDARKTSSVALTMAEASQTVIAQIKNACGPNSASTILQTKIASTVSAHFAEAAYCCENDKTCGIPVKSALSEFSITGKWWVITEWEDRFRNDRPCGIKCGVIFYDHFYNNEFIINSSDLEYFPIKGKWGIIGDEFSLVAAAAHSYWGRGHKVTLRVKDNNTLVGFGSSSIVDSDGNNPTITQEFNVTLRRE